MSKVLPYTGSVSGQGQEDLSFSWGANPTRAQRSITYSIDGGMNSLVVSQAASPALFITTNEASKTTSVSESAKIITFDGTTNARYLRYAVTPETPEITVSSVTENSVTDTSASVGTTYGEISNFIGGSQSYHVGISLSVPANITTSITVTVYASDSSDGTGAVSQSFTLTVSEPVDVTSVDVVPSELIVGIGNSYKYNNQTVTVNTESRNKLSYSLSPENATIANVNWVSGDTQIATVDSNGVVTGVANGETYIRCGVTDASGNTVYDNCDLTVYAEGTITGNAIKDITSVTTSSSHNITLHNIDRNTIAASPKSSVAWLTGVSVNTSTTPPTVDMTTTTNSGEDRDAEIDVTATDYLLNTVYHTFSLVQSAPSVDDVPCNNIYFAASSTVINNSENKGDYTISYSPVETTQKTLSWVLTGGGEGIATLEVDSEFSNRAYIHVFSGANNTPLTLAVTNTDTKTNPQKSASVNITATYVSNDGYLTATPSVVQLAYNDTVNDSTNGAPVITGESMSSIDSTPVLISGTIPKTMTFQGNTLCSTFDPNDDAAGSNPRIGTVRVWGTDNGGTRRYCDINYSQSPIGQDVNADMQISAVQAVYNSNDAVTALKVLVSYNNPFARNVTFSNQSITIKGTTDTGTVTLDEITRQLSDKTVPMLSNDSYEVYEINVEPRSAVTRFYVRIQATVNNSTIARPIQETWWDGTDPIDEQL